MKSSENGPRLKRATLRQVAEKAGVSAMTVSRAFRTEASVQPQLRQRILELARKMGYAPDPHVSSVMRAFVRRGRPDYRETLGFVGERCPIPCSFGERVFAGARLRAENQGYGLESFWMKEMHLTFARLNRLLRNRNIRGLLLCPFDSSPHMHVRLDWHRYALVAVGSSLWKPRINRAQPHHYMGMILALRSIRRISHGKIAFIISDLLHARSQGAYVSSFLTNQAASPRDLLSRIYRHTTWDPKRVREWLERVEPDVILCAEPTYVSQLRDTLTPRHKKIGIACLDVWNNMPDVAGIDQHSEIIGAQAVDSLLNAMQLGEWGVPEHPRTLMLEGSWRDGDSLQGNLPPKKIRRPV